MKHNNERSTTLERLAAVLRPTYGILRILFKVFVFLHTGHF